MPVRENVMSKPKNVLLITNSATDAELTQISAAINEANKQGLNIKLNLVHVVPTLPTCYFNIPSMAHIVERYYDEAKETLSYIGRKLDVPHNDQWLMTGHIRNETLRLANKLKTHFILASGSCIKDLRHSFLYNLLYKSDMTITPIQTISASGPSLNS
jgi:hypothetical protein